MTRPTQSRPSVPAPDGVFRAAFDHAPTGALILSPTGTIVQANRAINTLLGYADGDLPGLDILAVTHPEDAAQATKLEEGTSDKRYLRQDGTPVLVKELIAPLGPTHDGFVAHVVDIGARRTTDAKYRMVFDAAGIGISTGQDGLLNETNPAFQKMLGYSAEELSGMHYLDITHPDDHALDAKHMADLASGARNSFTVEKRYVRRDESVIWVRVTVTMAPDGSFGIGLIEDVSERRRLLARTVEAAEGERMAIAGELHDGPIQRLTALAFGLDLLARSLGRHGDDHHASLAEKARTAVAGEIASLRRMMSGLRPPLIDERGLDTAIRECTETMLADGPTTCTVDSRVGGRLPPELESVIYHLVRETLAGVRERARARHVEVGVVARRATIDVSIRIDEPKRDAIAEDAARSWQIAMQERVESVGGTLQRRELEDGTLAIDASFPSSGAIAPS